MRATPFVSIIIPCKKIDNYTKECIRYCRRLEYKNYEIIVLPDYQEEKIRNVKIIPTSDATPGKKRNIGVKHSSGELCAFIDSDAYPRSDWLRNAIKYFNNSNIAAVGGPGITPPDSSLMEKASGYILSSFMVGSLTTRYTEKGKTESDDIHSCNLIIRKSILQKIKWNEKYWPGEDTLMCLEIKKTGKKMLEIPNVVVYHHRRPLFIPHLKQVSQFGMHRGFFAKKFPQTSLRITYILPSLLVLFLIFCVFVTYIQLFRITLITVLLTYATLAFIAAVYTQDFILIPFVWIGIILTHLIYGAYFLVGVSKPELRR